METSLIVVIVVAILITLFLLVLIIKGIKIVPQSYFIVIERLGKYHKTLKNGLNFIVPFIDRTIKKDNFKEKVLDFDAQDVITKDNATIKVDTVVYLQITDPKLFTYGAENPKKAIENLSATTLRNLLGELELDETLTSRDTINTKLADILDSASDSWGIKVNRVELKNILPPKEIQTAMEKQMRAEREKRASILEAEGQRQSAVLEAEGLKQSSILKAEGQRQSAILKAQGVKESLILEAEGQKKAISLLLEANLNKEVLTWKSLEQLEKIADGQATKIIIPPNLTDVASTMATFGEIAGIDIKKKK
ncbi:SPFH/Band 7/PHB domain protein [Mycoplasma iguanae]|uniref:SPFH/Band 7/PHB domain protein n=1 Tax=Mycoplasma iguanae TaxID=292461 RepID=A0ABY5RB71_9MOLU|nr:SPFH domain-containing protein [Mycoplasma iguanae]UVD81997.1 SPFH/Band 7/PHB domain protein [Mycoplasma iguanae]